MTIPTARTAPVSQAQIVDVVEAVRRTGAGTTYGEIVDALPGYLGLADAVDLAILRGFLLHGNGGYEVADDWGVR